MTQGGEHSANDFNQTRRGAGYHRRIVDNDVKDESSDEEHTDQYLGNERP